MPVKTLEHLPLFLTDNAVILPPFEHHSLFFSLQGEGDVSSAQPEENGLSLDCCSIPLGNECFAGRVLGVSLKYGFIERWFSALALHQP